MYYVATPEILQNMYVHTNSMEYCNTEPLFLRQINYDIVSNWTRQFSKMTVPLCNRSLWLDWTSTPCNKCRHLGR